MKRAILLAARLFGAAPLPAHATAYCEVLKTRDGFAALRAAPEAGARLLVRVPSGEDVQLDSARRAIKGWRAVVYRGADRTGNIAGWMHGRLISNECG